MPLVYDAEKGRNLFQNSCLPFYQNTPGIYQFTPAFDEKTPAFRDTQNQVVFKKMNSCFLLAHFLFIPKFAYPAIGTKHLKNLFYEKERIYQSFCGLKGR